MLSCTPQPPYQPLPTMPTHITAVEVRETANKRPKLEEVVDPVAPDETTPCVTESNQFITVPTYYAASNGVDQPQTSTPPYSHDSAQTQHNWGTYPSTSVETAYSSGSPTFQSSRSGVTQTVLPVVSQYYSNPSVYTDTLSSSIGLCPVDSPANPYGAFAQQYGLRSFKPSPTYSFSPYFGTGTTGAQSYYASYGSDYVYYPQSYSSAYYAAAAASQPVPNTPYLGATQPISDSAAPYLIKDISPIAGSVKNDAPKKTRSKTKKRKAREPSSPSQENQWERVFIWDLDETLIIYESLLNTQFAQKYRKDIEQCLMAGCAMRKLYALLGDMQFFFRDLQDCDQVHIDDLVADDSGQDLSEYNFAADGFGSPLCLPAAPTRNGMDWMRKLALRYRKLRDMYSIYRDNPTGFSQLCEPESLVQCRADVDTVSDGWPSVAARALQGVAAQTRCANVLVSGQPLAPTLLKLLLFGVSRGLPVENIYSSSKIGKEACFERIQQRFGKKCTYIVVGDGHEEQSAAKKLGMPFWGISSVRDLMNLNGALEIGHL